MTLGLCIYSGIASLLAARILCSKLARPSATFLMEIISPWRLVGIYLHCPHSAGDHPVPRQATSPKFCCCMYAELSAVHLIIDSTTIGLKGHAKCGLKHPEAFACLHL